MDDHRWLVAWGLGSIAAGAASLLVPLYVVQLGGDPFELGLLGAVASFVGAPGAIVWGRLADRTANPRAVILFSLLGVAALLGIVPLLSSIPVLIAVNAALWLVFAAAGPVLTLLVVADTPESDWNREIALLNTYQGYGWAAGLLLGIVWSLAVGRLLSALATQQSLFLACAGASAIAAVLLLRWMPAPSDRQLDRVDARRVARLLSSGRRNVRAATFAFNPNRLYWSTRNVHPRRLSGRFTPTLSLYFLGVVAFFTGFAAFFAPLPLFLSDIGGFSSELVFGLYLLSALGSAAFYGGAGRLSSRYDLRLLQAAALGLRALAIPLVAVVGAGLAAGLSGTVVSAILFVVIGVAWAVIAVTAGTIVTRIAPADVRGEALGVYAALSALAGGIGSIAGGALATRFGFTIAFAVAGVAVLLGAVLVLALRGISARTRLTVDDADGRRSAEN
jgi:predicted MFS family arabinose efflux permease